MMLESFLPGLDLYVQLVRFFVVLVLGLVFTRAVLMPVVQRVAARQNKDKVSIHTFSNIVGIIGFFMSFIIALQAGRFGNIVTVLSAITAALTVAVGFGMRDQIGNLVAGFFIYTDRPFLKEDFIGFGDVRGRVKEINLRQTVLESPTSEKLVVPNSKLTGEPMTNYTKRGKINTSIVFKEKPDVASRLGEIAVDVLNSSDEVLEKPEPAKFTNKIDDGKMETEASYSIKESANPLKIKTSILDEVYVKAREEGIFEEKETEE